MGERMAPTPRGLWGLPMGKDEPRDVEETDGLQHIQR